LNFIKFVFIKKITGLVLLVEGWYTVYRILCQNMRVKRYQKFFMI